MATEDRSNYFPPNSIVMYCNVQIYLRYNKSHCPHCITMSDRCLLILTIPHYNVHVTRTYFVSRSPVSSIVLKSNSHACDVTSCHIIGTCHKLKVANIQTMSRDILKLQLHQHFLSRNKNILSRDTDFMSHRSDIML